MKKIYSILLLLLLLFLQSEQTLGQFDNYALFGDNLIDLYWPKNYYKDSAKYKDLSKIQTLEIS